MKIFLWSALPNNTDKQSKVNFNWLLGNKVLSGNLNPSRSLNMVLLYFMITTKLENELIPCSIPRISLLSFTNSYPADLVWHTKELPLASFATLAHTSFLPIKCIKACCSPGIKGCFEAVNKGPGCFLVVLSVHGRTLRCEIINPCTKSSILALSILVELATHLWCNNCLPWSAGYGGKQI